MRSRRQGASLILTLGVLGGILALLASTALTQRVAVQAVANRMETSRARLVARAGVQRALAELATQNLNQTTQNDTWFTLGQTGAERFLVGGDSFRVQIVDASSLIDLNTATEEELARLPLTQEQVDSLLDWRETSQTPRQDGAKDEYYNGLATPYNAKLGGLTTLDELLLIKGFTADTLYQAPTEQTSSQPLANKPDGTAPCLYDLVTIDATSGNVDSTGQQKPNIGTANVQALIQAGLSPQEAQAIVDAKPTTYSALLGMISEPQSQRAIVDQFSVSADATLQGKIDVNTATESVLDAVPNLPPDVASSIVSHQSTGFTGLGDLFDVPGFSGDVARNTLDFFTTNSRTFLVRVVGVAAGTNVSLEAVVTLGDQGPRILKIEESPYPDMSERWGWASETSTDTVLAEANP